MKTTQQRIDRWMELKQIEEEAKKERLGIEEFFATDRDRLDGKETFAGETNIAVVTYKSTVSIDQDIVSEFAKEYDKIPFRSEYKLDKKLYDAIKELNPDAHAEFSKAVTLKPAKPGFEIKELK